MNKRIINKLIIIILSILCISLYLKATNKIGIALILTESEDTPTDFYCEDTTNLGKVWISKDNYKEGDKVLYIKTGKTHSKVLLKVANSTIK